MSRIPCPVPDCPMPAKAGLMCGACQAELRRALASVPDVLGDLDVTLSRQTSRMGRGGHGSSAPLAFDPRASEAGYVLRSALAGWVRVLQEAQPEERPDDTAQAMAAWLSQRLSRILRHPAAPEAHGEITAAVWRAQRVTDRAPERQFAGRCQCGAALYAKPGASMVQCRECEAKPVKDEDGQRRVVNTYAAALGVDVVTTQDDDHITVSATSIFCGVTVTVTAVFAHSDTIPLRVYRESVSTQETQALPPEVVEEVLSR